jgi:hypothetical protein
LSELALAHPLDDFVGKFLNPRLRPIPKQNVFCSFQLLHQLTVAFRRELDITLACCLRLLRETVEDVYGFRESPRNSNGASCAFIIQDLI